MAFILLLVMIPKISLGMYSASPPNEVQISSFNFMGETGEKTNVGEVVGVGKALLLVPAYFNCNSTCPLLAENLKKAILGSRDSSRINVLFLSFNSEDSIETMKMFREHHALPADWTMGIIKNQSLAKDFLAQFQYTFQKTEDGFDHPNAAFVFSADSLIWTGSLFGVENTSEEIENAYQKAMLANQTGFKASVWRLAGKREYLILIGIIGTITPLLYVFWFFARRRRDVEIVGDA